MTKRDGIFAENDPFILAQSWMDEAWKTEINDANAMALASVDKDGMPNSRMVLLKEIEANAFVFYTNYGSVKAEEILGAGKASFVVHWKSLRRQIRCRGVIEKEDGPQADAYFASRSKLSRQGAWASDQSQPLATRQDLMDRVNQVMKTRGECLERPSYWGGIRIRPLEIEFWADGEARLHDRFRWTRTTPDSDWSTQRLYP